MILIITDKYKKIGSGNFYRSMNLYNELIRLKYSVKFISNSKIFIQENIFRKTKLIILDTISISKSNYYKLYRTNIKILCFDFFLNYPHHFNISIYEHSKINCINKKFIGKKYINIRNEFLKIKKKRINNKSILISVGSGDLKNHGLKAFNYLKSKNYDVKIVGGEFTSYSKVKNFDLISSDFLKFPKLINNFEYIISSGGSTLFESNFMNKKTFVLPQTNFEKNIARDFYQKNAIIGYNFQQIKKYNFIREKRKLKKIVDGNGIKRVINIIDKILCTL